MVIPRAFLYYYLLFILYSLFFIHYSNNEEISMYQSNPLLEKSLKFAARIVKLYQYLVKEKKETIISKQILRSGTSIGANANEAAYGTRRKYGRLYSQIANIS